MVMMKNQIGEQVVGWEELYRWEGDEEVRERSRDQWNQGPPRTTDDENHGIGKDEVYA